MSVISETERSLNIALEQVAWWRSQGWTPRRAREVLKRRPARSYARREWSWPEVVDAVADAWRKLP